MELIFHFLFIKNMAILFHILFVKIFYFYVRKGTYRQTDREIKKDRQVEETEREN